MIESVARDPSRRDYDPITQDLERPALSSVRLSVDIPSNGSDICLEKIHESTSSNVEENDAADGDTSSRCLTDSKDDTDQSVPDLVV